MNDQIQLIPIERIRILNPRHRDKKKFATIVQSIQTVGLKKPIQVSLRSVAEGTEPGFDLICGQGRIEAYVALGRKEIEAIVVEISREDRLLRSVVENMARRGPTRLAMINEIERLKSAGYNFDEIGSKLGISDTHVRGLLTLKAQGEERLLDAAISGVIPLRVAMEIAKAETLEMQRELLKAYESKQLPGVSMRTIIRLAEQRRNIGKERSRSTGPRKTSAESMITAYRREGQRKKLLITKSRVCDAKLMFVVTALKKLLSDDNFVNLLKAEGLVTLPSHLAEMFSAKLGETK